MQAFLLLALLPPALISHHLLDEGLSSIDGEGEECSSSSGIYMPLRHGREPLVEVLKHEPVLHSIVRAGLEVILEPFPCLRDGFE